MKKAKQERAPGTARGDQDYGALPDPSPAGDGEELVFAPGMDMGEALSRLAGPAAEQQRLQVRCNWDLATYEGKARLITAMNPATLELGPEGSCDIRACYWCTYQDEGINEETGEETTFLRTVLLDKDGRSLRTSSDHIARKICGIFALFTPEEVAAGLPLRLVERRSRKLGQVYHALELVMPAEGGL